jgi:hypothetical protein
MEAKELMLGNLVNGISEDSDGKNKQIICKILAIDSNSTLGDGWQYMVESMESDECLIYDDFEPIPLTEEWLELFGFEKRESSVCDSFYIGINPITHDWLFDLAWLKNMIDYSYEGYPFYKNGYHEIKFVHQLQNLYYTLTGKELTLNPNK